jgi:hypothetical protein
MHQVRNLTTLKGDTEWEKAMLKSQKVKSAKGQFTAFRSKNRGCA